MKTIIHKAETRGHADYGWLDTHHTFSFANYHDPERIHFGVLRVLNDDWVKGGSGFDRHPHDNMEIISIPIEGEMEHKDSMGNIIHIRKNDVQVMSAGTGIFHAEYNSHPEKPLSFLQIWVFPEEQNISPRYDQRTFEPEDRKNKWQQIISYDDPSAMKIMQKAWFSLLSLDAGRTETYELKMKGNGVYIFLLSGSADIEGNIIEKRDGIGLWETGSVSLKAIKGCELLLMEVPMESSEVAK